MPQRPNVHVLEDQSRNRLATAFEDEGWTVERVTRDYGEDLLVRIFCGGQATPLFFFVQAKATGNLDRLLVQDGAYISVPVAADHDELWCEFWPPVILTIWDAAANRTYWECVQSSVEIGARRRPRLGATRIWIPVANVLDRQGIGRILDRTETRLSRHAREREGAAHLVAVLRDNFGLQIEYDPQFGILQVPDGQFVPTPGAGPRMFPFGRFAREMDRIANILGVSTEEAFNIILGRQLDLLRRVADGEPVIVRGPNGEILTEWCSPADVRNDYIRLLEQDDGP